MAQKIIFFSNILTNRLHYIATFILGDLLGLEVVFTQDADVFMTSDLPKIQYDKTHLPVKSVFIESHVLLFEDVLKKYDINANIDFFSTTNTNSDFDFDIFARSFFLISRYEEYTLSASAIDVHGRFTAAASIAAKLGFLQQPVVNQWSIHLLKTLLIKFPHLKYTLPTYRYQPTFDIDMAWSVRHKGILRTIYPFVQDIWRGQWINIRKRVNILRGSEKDPSDTFDDILQFYNKHNTPLIFFWLLGDYGRFDKNTYWKNKKFQDLIRHIADSCKVGIHPSYRSNDDINILRKEITRLTTILHVKSFKKDVLFTQNARITEGVTFPSRQHFLKLTFPYTYQNLIYFGIQDDFSMGYADDTGFRAGVATPFKWFDLSRNEVTDLTIHPFQVMDVTLKNYLKLTPDEALTRIYMIADAIRAVGGTFTSLCHNDNISETGAWIGWRRVLLNSEVFY